MSRSRNYSAKVGIIQPNQILFSQILFSQILFSQMGYYSAKCIEGDIWLNNIFSQMSPSKVIWWPSTRWWAYYAYLSPPCLFSRHVGWGSYVSLARTYANGSHPTRLSKDLNSEPTKNQPTTVGVYMGGYFLSAKYLLFSQIFIIQPNGNYSAKYYSAKYYSAKWNIIQPNEILFSQVGILFSQTAGWLASEARCELAKSLHSEICRQARIL